MHQRQENTYAFVRLGGRLSITQLQLTGSAAQDMLLSMYSGTAMLWNHELDVVDQGREK